MTDNPSTEQNGLAIARVRNEVNQADAATTSLLRPRRRAHSYCAETAWVWERARLVCTDRAATESSRVVPGRLER